MSDMLSIGASSLRVYQSAISNTSENIANASTPGYSKRTALVKEIPATYGVRIGGNGSAVAGVARSSDQFRVADVRVASSDLAKSESSVSWLQRIEGALSNNQLGDRLTSFFNAASGVAADPAATAPRAVMLENAQSVATAFTGTNNSLTAASEDLRTAGEQAAADLTSLASKLDQVNNQIGKSSDGSTVRASLLDQRDQLLEQMSGYVDIDVRIDNLNRATVSLGGSSGPVLVDPQGTSAVTFQMGDNGATAFTAHRGGNPQAIAVHSGSFAGVADAAQRIAGARETLDDLATRFVSGVNAAQSSGRDLDSQQGTAMFAAGTPASQVTVSLTDPRGIAAANPGEGTRGNGNMAAFSSMRTEGDFEGGVADLTAANAAALASRKDVTEAQTSIRAAAVAARDAVSGVNLDEEAIDLIRYQQAYQASARVIQVARETLQSIFDIR